MESSDAILWTARIAAIVTFLQTIELLSLRNTFGPLGIWRWEIVRKDFAGAPAIFRRSLDTLLAYRSFIAILMLRLVASVALLLVFHPLPVLFLFISSLLISLRWRGSFNGGSDFMNLIVLSALSIASLFQDSSKAQTACLWYIAIQTCTSYFLAGLIKLRRANWRSGWALSGFLRHSIYVPSAASRFFEHSSRFSRWASWTVMLFECLFPLALLDSRVCVAFLIAGFLFHLGNVYFLGLNRFLLSWLTAYPALLFCSQLSGSWGKL